jgi:hypothetical protein
LHISTSWKHKNQFYIMATHWSDWPAAFTPWKRAPNTNGGDTSGLKSFINGTLKSKFSFLLSRIKLLLLSATY